MAGRFLWQGAGLAVTRPLQRRLQGVMPIDGWLAFWLMQLLLRCAEQVGMGHSMLAKRSQSFSTMA